MLVTWIGIPRRSRGTTLTANRQRRLGTALGQIERQLRPGVPRADHQHPLPDKRLTVAVARRMQNRAAKALLLGEPLRVRHAVVSGGNDHGPRSMDGACSLDVEPAVRRADPADRLAGSWRDRKTSGVSLQVGDEVGARHVAGQLLGERKPWEVRLLLDRVQVQPVIVIPPRVSQRRSGLEHQRVYVALLETGGGGQAGRTGTDDHDWKWRARMGGNVDGRGHRRPSYRRRAPARRFRARRNY
jgi:hypothetical protein